MPTGALRFAEKMGLLFEALGASRSAGKIFGWLIVAEQPQSLEDIAAALSISKASASTNTRVLVSIGVIEKVGVRGDRKAYYQAVDGFWKTILHVSTSGKLHMFVNVFEEGQRLVSKENTIAQKRMAHMEKAYRMFQEKALAWAKELEDEMDK